MNQSVSGTRASAVTRCAHQWANPAWADPRPRARPSGERIMSICGVLSHGCPLPNSQTDDPDQDRETPVAMTTAQPDML